MEYAPVNQPFNPGFTSGNQISTSLLNNPATQLRPALPALTLKFNNPQLQALADKYPGIANQFTPDAIQTKQDLVRLGEQNGEMNKVEQLMYHTSANIAIQQRNQLVNSSQDTGSRVQQLDQIINTLENYEAVSSLQDLMSGNQPVNGSGLPLTQTNPLLAPLNIRFNNPTLQAMADQLQSDPRFAEPESQQTALLQSNMSILANQTGETDKLTELFIHQARKSLLQKATALQVNPTLNSFPGVSQQLGQFNQLDRLLAQKEQEFHLKNSQGVNVNPSTNNAL